MPLRRRLFRARGLLALAGLVAPGPVRGGVATDARPTAFNRRLNRFDASAVKRAQAGAARWLQKPECRKTLTDFTDGEGRTLDRNLEPWGMSAPEYVQTLSFRDGSGLPQCGEPRVELVTVPGFPRVYVCPGRVGTTYSRFARTQMQLPALAEAMVIHEMLHTLGLGENPPTSLEITERVRARCR